MVCCTFQAVSSSAKFEHHNFKARNAVTDCSGISLNLGQVHTSRGMFTEPRDVSARQYGCVASAQGQMQICSDSAALQWHVAGITCISTQNTQTEQRSPRQQSSCRIYQLACLTVERSWSAAGLVRAVQPAVDCPHTCAVCMMTAISIAKELRLLCHWLPLPGS